MLAVSMKEGPNLEEGQSGSKRRFVILADFLPPDFGAVGQYMLLRAEALAAGGHDVQLFGLTSGSSTAIRRLLGVGRLTEIRLSVRPVPRSSLAARALWTALTNLRLVSSAFVHLRAADEILFTGAPPFMIHFLLPLRFLWRGRLVYRITDFHPECVIAARQRSTWWLSLLQRLTDFWRRRVDAFEVLGEDQRRRLLQKGVSNARISLVRDQSPVVFTPADRACPLPPELRDGCVLLYSGNFGVAHDVDTIAEGYRLHHGLGSRRVRLWLNATGQGAEELEARLLAWRLPVFRSPPVPLTELAGLLLAPHGHLISLKDAFAGYVLPSKIYACLESGKPLIFVGSPASDVDSLARERSDRPYWPVPCGDAAAFALALEGLADHSARVVGK